MGAGRSNLYSGTNGSSPMNGISYNTAGSTSVGRVDIINNVNNLHHLPEKNTPNSVVRNFRQGVIVTERYYNEKGEAYLDIDYTNHGNPVRHPTVPHQHEIRIVNNHIKRGEQEEIK